MDLPPILFQNYKGILLAHLLIHETSDEKLWQNSIFAIFENEPEMTLGPKIKKISKFKVYLGQNNNLTPNEYTDKLNNC